MNPFEKNPMQNVFYKIIVDDKVFRVTKASLLEQKESALTRVILGQEYHPRIVYQPPNKFVVDADPDSFMFILAILRGYHVNENTLPPIVKKFFQHDLKSFGITQSGGIQEKNLKVVDLDLDILSDDENLDNFNALTEINRPSKNQTQTGGVNTETMENIKNLEQGVEMGSINPETMYSLSTNPNVINAIKNAQPKQETESDVESLGLTEFETDTISTPTIINL